MGVDDNLQAKLLSQDQGDGAAGRYDVTGARERKRIRPLGRDGKCRE